VAVSCGAAFFSARNSSTVNRIVAIVSGGNVGLLEIKADYLLCITKPFVLLVKLRLLLHTTAEALKLLHQSASPANPQQHEGSSS
jgi:hypothetical protein